MKGQNPQRVLTIHATSRGFAFCLFDGIGTLTDWGIKHVGKDEKNAHCLRIIEHLVQRYDPHALVIEDVDERGGRRSSRVRKLYRETEKLADRSKLETYSYPWQVVFQVFEKGQPRTRHDLAVMIAEICPEISRRLPPKRKIWLPQDPRQALFDAAALGITYYAVSDS